MLNAINQFLVAKPDILIDCFQVWNSPKYGLVQKGSFHSSIGKNHRYKAKGIYTFLQTFKFEVDVIQQLGAAQNAQKEALYNESFLNMLQRFDIDKSIKFSLPDVRSKGEPLFEAKGSTLHLMIIQVLTQALWQDTTLIFSEN